MVVWASRAAQAHGEVDSRPPGGLPVRRAGPRPCLDRRDGARQGRPFLGCRVTTYAALGAYLSHFSAFIPTMAGIEHAGRPLPDAGDLREREGRDDQHRADRRLSRRRAARGGLSAGALRRPYRARDRARARRDPRPQLHQAWPDPVEDGAGRHLQFGRLRERHAQGHGAGRLEGLRRPPRRSRRAQGKWRGIGMATYVEKCSRRRRPRPPSPSSTTTTRSRSISATRPTARATRRRSRRSVGAARHRCRAHPHRAGRQRRRRPRA